MKKQTKNNREEQILDDILGFFRTRKVFEKRRAGDYRYEAYSPSWLKQIAKGERKLREEASTARTTNAVQTFIKEKYPEIHVEAPVAEGMQLRFTTEGKKYELEPAKMQRFDFLDVETGTAYEISLADAFAEFFKDVLKALLDSRVKKLCIIMRNHKYKGSDKSGFVKVNDSPMVQQHITLARLCTLDIELVKIEA